MMPACHGRSHIPGVYGKEYERHARRGEGSEEHAVQVPGAQSPEGEPGDPEEFGIVELDRDENADERERRRQTSAH